MAGSKDECLENELAKLRIAQQKIKQSFNFLN